MLRAGVWACRGAPRARELSTPSHRLAERRALPGAPSLQFTIFCSPQRSQDAGPPGSDPHQSKVVSRELAGAAAMAERKPVIKSTDMTDEMQQDAVSTAQAVSESGRAGGAGLTALRAHASRGLRSLHA